MLYVYSALCSLNGFIFDSVLDWLDIERIETTSRSEENTKLTTSGMYEHGAVIPSLMYYMLKI